MKKDNSESVLRKPIIRETIKDSPSALTIPSHQGSSRDIPATLNNIVKIMRRSKGPAQEGGFSSDDSRLAIVRAKYAPRFKTLEEVKKARGNIDPKRFMEEKKRCCIRI